MSTLSSNPLQPEPPVSATREAARARERFIILEPGRAERNYWSDLWHYRELFAILAWRDVTVRYKQTVIGVAWALIRPFLTMVVFTIIFGKMAKLPSDGETPYAVMVFAGILPWFLFSSILTDASSSLIGSANLISKVYFPRMIIPAASAIVSLIDFGVNLVLLALIMCWYRFLPSINIFYLPAFILLAVMASFGPALVITSLNVKYRDVRYVVPFIVQLGMYISPVAFSSSIVPEEWRFCYSLNPLVGVIDGFRWCLLGGQSQIYWPGLLISFLVACCLCLAGIRRFRATENSFADSV